jgi:hypothetical protein
MEITISPKMALRLIKLNKAISIILKDGYKHNDKTLDNNQVIAYLTEEKIYSLKFRNSFNNPMTLRIDYPFVP